MLSTCRRKVLPYLEHECILSSVFGKVPLYHLDGATSDATYSPDWNGNKIEELTTRYVDRTESDFLKTYRTFERNAVRGDFMAFYLIVEGYKIRWWLSATKSSKDGKEFLSITLSSKPTQQQIRRIKRELKIGKSTVFVANQFL